MTLGDIVKADKSNKYRTKNLKNAILETKYSAIHDAIVAARDNGFVFEKKEHI